MAGSKDAIRKVWEEIDGGRECRRLGCSPESRRRRRVRRGTTAVYSAYAGSAVTGREGYRLPVGLRALVASRGPRSSKGSIFSETGPNDGQTGK